MANPQVALDIQNDPFFTQGAATASRGPGMSTMGRSVLSQKMREKWPSGGGRQNTWEQARNSPAFIFFAGALCPGLMFIGIVAMFSFDWLIPSFAWFLVFVLISIVIAVVWPLPPPHVDGMPVRRHNWEWFPAGACFFAVALGCIMGSVNYNVFVLPYMHYRFNREYTNLNPSENAKAYGDAGVIYFTASARVDLAKSAGFQEWNRFCVAPIVGEETGAPVGFWAAGLDCCESRHNFRCGDAVLPEAKGGVRISETDPMGEYLPQFKKAVAMAAQVYGFEASDEPVMVHWVEDPKEYAHQQWVHSLIFFGLCGVFSLIMMCVNMSLMHSAKMA